MAGVEPSSGFPFLGNFREPQWLPFFESSWAWMTTPLGSFPHGQQHWPPATPGHTPPLPSLSGSWEE